MLLLALDTTTRGGSAALQRGGRLLDCETGNPALTHAERLPADLIRLLDRNAVGVADVDLFAVAAGPGSFTGLRIGIATMQGLALANGRRMIGVSSLDALNATARLAAGLHADGLVGAWMDAQRGEVFASLYRGSRVVDGPRVGKPADVLAAWGTTIGTEPISFAGDGAAAYAQLITQAVPGADVVRALPPLAPAVARLAEEEKHQAVDPADLRPVYVRRPDAELARERAAARS